MDQNWSCHPNWNEIQVRIMLKRCRKSETFNSAKSESAKWQNTDLDYGSFLPIHWITAEVTWIKLQYKVDYFRYFVQVTAIKSADISGRQYYELQMKDLSFSPQCLGLGVPSEEEGRGPSCKREELTWRHDMDSRETAACMGESYTLP